MRACVSETERKNDARSIEFCQWIPFHRDSPTKTKQKKINKQFRKPTITKKMRVETETGNVRRRRRRRRRRLHCNAFLWQMVSISINSARIFIFHFSFFEWSHLRLRAHSWPIVIFTMHFAVAQLDAVVRCNVPSEITTWPPQMQFIGYSALCSGRLVPHSASVAIECCVRRRR